MAVFGIGWITDNKQQGAKWNAECECIFKLQVPIFLLLHPLAPAHAVAVDDAVRLELGALGLWEVAHLAAVEVDLLLLLLVKDVEATAEGVAQVLDVARRVQRVPRPHARLALARFEHEQQRVEPGDDLPEGHAEQRGGGLGALAEEVVELVGVRLKQRLLVSLFLSRDRGKHTFKSYSSCSLVHHTE